MSSEDLRRRHIEASQLKAALERLFSTANLPNWSIDLGPRISTSAKEIFDVDLHKPFPQPIVGNVDYIMHSVALNKLLKLGLYHARARPSIDVLFGRIPFLSSRRHFHIEAALSCSARP